MTTLKQFLGEARNLDDYKKVLSDFEWRHWREHSGHVVYDHANHPTQTIHIDKASGEWEHHDSEQPDAETDSYIDGGSSSRDLARHLRLMRGTK